MYKKIIICCYSRNNEILKSIVETVKKYFKKYELVEKITVKLPNIFKNLSLVILDGNF